MNTLDQAIIGGKGGKNARARRLLAAVTVAALAIAFIPGAGIVTYPLRLFATIVHEGGHALMTYFTGGSVDSIGISPDGSGVTYSRGGLPFFVYMAGYLGTAAFGALCLHLARGASGRRSLLTLAALIGGITLLWIHPWSSPFGFIAGVVIAGLMLVAARGLSNAPAQFLAAFLSVQLALNALYDVRDLLFLTAYTHSDNDAKFMAEAFGGTPWFWAGLWAVGAALILAVSLRSFWRATR